jgi:hypothetical protein
MGFPFCILALAAGVYLLVQVKHFGFGGIYKGLAWLVILLSLICLSFCATRGFMHMRHMRECGRMMGGHCDMKGGDNACPYMRGGHGPMGGGNCCDMNGGAMGQCASSNMSTCCAKDSSAKKCDMAKSACCMKGAGNADSTGHK